MNKLLITASIIIAALTTQGCEEYVNDFYTNLLITNHDVGQPVYKV